MHFKNIIVEVLLSCFVTITNKNPAFKLETLIKKKIDATFT